MSRPLLAKPQRNREASGFHKAVFARYGPRCFFCAAYATDAAHVLRRTLLGPARYADPRLARPACRRCHDAQHAGKLRWPVAVVREAIRVHNTFAKVKLPE